MNLHERATLRHPQATWPNKMKVKTEIPWSILDKLLMINLASNQWRTFLSLEPILSLLPTTKRGKTYLKNPWSLYFGSMKKNKNIVNSDIIEFSQKAPEPPHQKQWNTPIASKKRRKLKFGKGYWSWTQSSGSSNKKSILETNLKEPHK